MKTNLALTPVGGNKNCTFTLDTKKNSFTIETGNFKKEILKTVPVDQVIECIFSYESEFETKKKKKSVIGRGIVGGVVLGPVGAVVGGMSAVPETKISKEKNRRIKVYIEYLDGDVFEGTFTSLTVNQKLCELFELNVKTSAKKMRGEEVPSTNSFIRKK